MTKEEILIALIKSELTSTKLSSHVLEMITPDIISELIPLAKSHDLVHVISSALYKNHLGADSYVDYAASALFRYEQFCYGYEQICAALYRAKVPFVPLKGSVLRPYYPDPAMRTSCDIDILVHEDDLARAVECLQTSCAYTAEKYNYHDVTMISPDGIHLELHFSIQEYMDKMDAVLSRVWDYTVPVNEYEYKLSDEFFVFHILSHMTYHFVEGGCGIRSFMDLWVMKHKMGIDLLQTELLQQGGIAAFSKAAVELMEVWFEGKKPTSLTQTMQEFIICGGLYGNRENKAAAGQKVEKHFVRFAMQRIFLPYSKLKLLYPVLEKHPMLFPMMTIKRWIQIMQTGRLSRRNRYRVAVSTEKEKTTQMLFRELDIGWVMRHHK